MANADDAAAYRGPLRFLRGYILALAVAAAAFPIIGNRLGFPIWPALEDYATATSALSVVALAAILAMRDTWKRLLALGFSFSLVAFASLFLYNYFYSASITIAQMLTFCPPRMGTYCTDLLATQGDSDYQLYAAAKHAQTSIDSTQIQPASEIFATGSRRVSFQQEQLLFYIVFWLSVECAILFFGIWEYRYFQTTKHPPSP